MRKFLLTAAALMLTTATISYAGDCCGTQPPVANYTSTVQLQPVPDAMPMEEAVVDAVGQPGCCPKACNPVAAPAACCPAAPACCPDPCCPPKKKNVLGRLWDLEKRKNAWLMRTFIRR